MIQTQPRNKFEQLGHDQLIRAKVKFEYEQVKLPYTLEKQYLPDFVTFDKKTGKMKLIIEFKGYFDLAAQVKMKAVKRTNPDLDIRFIFQDSTKKVRKGSKLSYADWADKYGFVWAQGSIPKAWLK